MKKRILLLSAGALFTSVVLLSNAGGPAHVSYVNRTGSDGVLPSCATGGCHSGGSYYLTMPSIALYDLQQNNVTGYTPGDTYLINLAGQTDAPKWGFQISSAFHHGTSWDPAGTFLAVNPATHDTTINGFSILEHKYTLNVQNQQTVMNMRWIAPTDTTIDSVSFRCTYNLVNGDGLTTGDNSEPAAIKVLKAGVIVSTKELNAELKLRAYPNPVTDQLNIEMQNADKGAYTLKVFGIDGKTVASQTLNITGTYSLAVNSSAWAKGIYHLQLQKGEAQRTMTIIKQ